MLDEALTKVKMNYRPIYYARELIKALLAIFNTMSMYVKC